MNRTTLEETRTARDLVADTVVKTLVDDGAKVKRDRRLERYTDLMVHGWEITIERSHRPGVIEVRIFDGDHNAPQLVEFEALGLPAAVIVGMINAVLA